MDIFFGMSAEFWINLQSHNDLESVKGEMEDRLRAEVQTFKELAA